jgi:hypothetical protein
MWPSSEWAGVWHLSETLGTTAQDATNAGTGLDTGTAAATAAGIVGYARQLTKTDELCHSTPSSALDVSPGFTVEAWVKPTAPPGSYDVAFRKGDPVDGLAGWNLGLTGPDTWHMDVRDTTGMIKTKTVSGASPGQWSQIALVVDATKQFITYVNATGTTPELTTLGNVGPDAPVCLGQASMSVVGLVDEVRVHKVGRTAEWLAYAYRNFMDRNSFMTVSEEVTQ